MCHCVEPLIPVASDVITGINKSTAGKSIGIAVGVMASLVIVVLICWATSLVCKKKGIFYSDKLVLKLTKLPSPLQVAIQGH